LIDGHYQWQTYTTTRKAGKMRLERIAKPLGEGIKATVYNCLRSAPTLPTSSSASSSRCSAAQGIEEGKCGAGQKRSASLRRVIAGRHLAESLVQKIDDYMPAA